MYRLISFSYFTEDNRTVFNTASDEDFSRYMSSAIEKFDRTHLWHPYSPLPGMGSWTVHGAEGPYLYLSKGTEQPCRVLDAMSSWWAAAYGYRHPALDAAAHQQIDHFSHVMFGGLTHRPAVELGEKILSMTPADLDTIFYCDSGSVSVEIAVKMALQYWRSHKDTALHKKTRLLTWRSGYHGDTFTPMSVCDPEGGMHSLWEGVVRQQIFVSSPPSDPQCSLMSSIAPSGTLSAKLTAAEKEFLAEVRQTLEQKASEIAALIIEPIVQGAGGMRFHRPQLVKEVVGLCRDYQILIIFDEIATGFGRSGEIFATVECGIAPDIMCIGKALTGGYLTAAAVLSTHHIGETISHNMGALMHGPTFMGNPLACAIASTACDLAQQSMVERRTSQIEKNLRRELQPACDITDVVDVRVRGAIGVIEMAHSVDLVAATQAALAEGVWIRPFGRLIYCMPPYICTPSQVSTICRGMRAAATTVRGN